GRGTSGRPCCSRFNRSRSSSSMRTFQDVTAAALLESARAEQQTVRQVIQARLPKQLADLLPDFRALLAVHHAEQVVGPVGRAARSLVAEIDAGGVAKLLAGLVDQVVGYVDDQHGVGPKTQGAMIQYQADAAE